MVFSSYAAFQNITGHSFLGKQRDKYNSTVHKKPQTVILFLQKI